MWQSAIRELASRYTARSSLRWLLVALTLVGLAVQLCVVALMASATEQTLAALGVASSGRINALVRATVPLPDGEFHAIALLSAASVGLVVLWAIARGLEGIVLGAMAVEGADRLRHALVRQAYRIPAFSASLPDRVSQIDRLVSSGAASARRGLRAWYEAVLRDPVVAVFCLIAALVIAPLQAVGIAVAAVAAVLASSQLVGPFRRLMKRAARIRQECEVATREILRVCDVSRANAQEEYDLQRLSELQKHCLRAEKGEERLGAWVWPLVVLPFLVAGILIGLLLAWSLLADKLAVSDAAFVVGALALGVIRVQNAWALRAELKSLDKTVGEALGLLYVDEAVYQLPDARFMPPLEHELRFRDVKVERGGQVLLDSVSFVVPKDARVAVLSTDPLSARALAYLVPRLYDPDEGVVLIDGRNIRTATLESLRAHVGLAVADAYVSFDTVRGNIADGDKTVPFTRIVAAAKMAHAHQFIQRLKDGYDTVIGPHGVQLTTGEQFRIALARLILKDPAIAIIEEPDTVLDEDTRQLVEDTLNRFCPNRAVIFLARRVSTLKSADQVVLLHNGVVEDIGTHAELTQRSELYRHLQYALAQRRKLILAASAPRD